MTSEFDSLNNAEPKSIHYIYSINCGNSFSINIQVYTVILPFPTSASSVVAGDEIEWLFGVWSEITHSSSRVAALVITLCTHKH